jgi:hypothetical protein
VFKQEFTRTQRKVAVLCDQSALWSVTTVVTVVIVAGAIINRNSFIAIIRPHLDRGPSNNHLQEPRRDYPDSSFYGYQLLCREHLNQQHLVR